MKLLVTVTLLLFFSSSGLAQNEKSLELFVNEANPQIESTEQWSYNFGSVFINTSRYADFFLKNIGSTPLKIREISISGAAFQAWSNCPLYLRPEERCLTRVEFRPWFEGSHYGRLRYILTGKIIYVNLYGWGLR